MLRVWLIFLLKKHIPLTCNTLSNCYYTGGSMGSTKTVLPERKFSGEDIQDFLRDFEIYVTVNEWLDEKAGQYLAVLLKDDAKAFYH